MGPESVSKFPFSYKNSSQCISAHPNPVLLLRRRFFQIVTFTGTRDWDLNISFGRINSTLNKGHEVQLDHEVRKEDKWSDE